jgi:hypothetical protein
VPFFDHDEIYYNYIEHVQTLIRDGKIRC